MTSETLICFHPYVDIIAHQFFFINCQFLSIIKVVCRKQLDANVAFDPVFNSAVNEATCRHVKTDLTYDIETHTQSLNAADISIQIGGNYFTNIQNLLVVKYNYGVCVGGD